MPEVRVLVVDDHPLIRDGTIAAIDQAPDIRVIGVADCGTDALKLLEELSPDVLLLDLRLPDISGLEVARRTHVARRSTAIIALTGYESPIYVRTLTELGARAFLTKTATGTEIVAAIRTVAAGHSMLSNACLGAHSSGPLTCREEEVLQLLAHGKHNQEIATDLCISAKTVEFHLRRIFTKLNVRSRTEAATRAHHLGVVE